MKKKSSGRLKRVSHYQIRLLCQDKEAFEQARTALVGFVYQVLKLNNFINSKSNNIIIYNTHSFNVPKIQSFGTLSDNTQGLF